MTCRELAEFLGDYLADALRPEVRAAFEHHLTLCPNCDRYLAQYQQSSQFARVALQISNAPVPAEVPEDLIEAILAARVRA